MFHIVLFLLKLIGIILASILGLLLFLLLVVLMVPIRYRINADNREEIRAEAKISWLFRIIYIRILYLDNKLRIILRLFGKVLYDSSNLKSKKEPKKSKEPGKLIKFRKNKKLEIKTDVKSAKPLKVENERRPTEISKDENEVKAAEISSIKNEVKRTEISKVQNDQAEETKERQDLKAEFQREKKHKGIFAWFKRFFLKIKEFFSKIKNWFIRIKNFFRNLKEKISRISEKWDKIKEFLKGELNKKAFSKILITLRKILKHLRPTKLKLELEFGTGDPCSTGQALGVMAIFYGYYGKSVQIIPNFEEVILEGSLFCIGRIRLFTLLIIGTKLILNKNFRQLLKNFKALKEDL